MVSDKFWRLFQACAPPEPEKLKTGPRWLGLARETYTHCLGYSSYRFASVRQKNVSVEFRRLLWARVPPAQPKLKIGPRWLRFALESYPHSLWCSFYRFPSVRLKNNSVKFWRLFRGHGTIGVGKVENRARITRFFTQNIPTLLIFIVFHQYGWKMFRSNFDDFSGTSAQEQENLKTGPIWLDLAPETYPYFSRQ